MSSAKQQLTEDEATFCELYVNGSIEYVGNAAKCYSAVFQVQDPRRTRQLGRMLLIEPRIAKYVSELEKLAVEESKGMKRYLTENLISIIGETSTAQYYDRNGTSLSPAPLRSVAVGAMKLLADMYPVKEAQISKLNIEGGDGASITFNVIVPDAKPNNDPTE